MKIGVSTLERAFEIARSGLARDVEEIRRALQREGYNAKEIEGPGLRKQLRGLTEAAREPTRGESISEFSEAWRKRSWIIHRARRRLSKPPALICSQFLPRYLD